MLDNPLTGVSPCLPCLNKLAITQTHRVLMKYVVHHWSQDVTRFKNDNVLMGGDRVSDSNFPFAKFGPKCSVAQAHTSMSF